jgi:hypothetical protein
VNGGRVLVAHALAQRAHERLDGLPAARPACELIVS